MNRTDRLELLVRVLRDQPGITAGQLARQFETSIRSVFRDLDHLRERGYLIEASRGRGGGLRLHPRWGLGRVQLSPEEALGVLLAMAVTDQSGLPMFGAGLRRARKKLVDAFPYNERRQLTSLRERVLVGPSASAKVTASYRSPNASAMQRLQSAFVKERLVVCTYIREDGERTERRVQPHAMLLNWPAWYLLGFDQLRGAVRTFRLDRFEAVTELPEGFRPRPHVILGHIEGITADDPQTWRL